MVDDYILDAVLDKIKVLTNMIILRFWLIQMINYEMILL